MLSINTIARVAVNVVRSASQPTSFDTGALLDITELIRVKRENERRAAEAARD